MKTSVSHILVGVVGKCSLMGMASHPAHAVTGGEVVPRSSIGESVASVGGYEFTCSGVAISPSWVLTAGHCVDNMDTVIVDLGSEKEQGRYKGKVHQHPNVDLALLHLDGQHDGTYAQLPTSFPQVGVTGQVVGFGMSQSRPLSSAQYSITKVEENSYLSYPDYGVKNDSAMYISHNSSFGHVQKGDSGAPLFINNQLHGIFSHGYYRDGEFKDMKSVTVADNIDWITNTTGINHMTRYAISQQTSAKDNAVKADDNALYRMLKLTPQYINPFVIDNGPYDQNTPIPTPPQEEHPTNPKPSSLSANLSS